MSFPRLHRARHAFTLIEIITATSILGLVAVLAAPVLGGFFANTQVATDRTNARALVMAVSLYRMKTGQAIAGSPQDPMTLARANEIYAQIAGPLPGTGEVIVPAGFVLNPRASFPASWGELSSGVFEAVP